MPLTVSGLNEAGVTPLTTFRSKVSVWLGAPASRMKITFLRGVLGGDSGRGNIGGARVPLRQRSCR